MKAWVLHNIGDIRFETVGEPALSDNEVLVAVKASGICGSDIPRVYQTGTYSHPLIPGHEFSGVVEKVGAGVDTKWLQKRVGIFPLIPCKTCISCRKKQYEMCSHYSYLGSRRDGGFAEYAAVPADNLIVLPAHVSYEEAAMMEPMAVAVHSMRRIAPSVTDTVVICGLGTIGTLLLMFLIEAGIKNIFVIGNKAFQKQTVLKMGLQEERYCDSRERDVAQWIMEHTDGVGTDVFFECVGKNETYALAVNVSASAGQICLIGNPYSDMGLEKAVYWKILRNQLRVTGTWNSSFTHDTKDDWHYILDRLKEKKITPTELISQRCSLDEVLWGLEIMRNKTEDYIKIMAVME